jgi:hypothetical protein
LDESGWDWLWIEKSVHPSPAFDNPREEADTLVLALRLLE